MYSCGLSTLGLFSDWSRRGSVADPENLFRKQVQLYVAEGYQRSVMELWECFLLISLILDPQPRMEGGRSTLCSVELLLVLPWYRIYL